MSRFLTSHRVGEGKISDSLPGSAKGGFCPGEPLSLKLERVMRFELTTLCLGSTYSTAELHPQVRFNYRQQDKSLSTSSRGDPTGRP